MFRDLASDVRRVRHLKIFGAVLMASTAMSNISVSTAVAQTTTAARTFDIPSQPLPQALMIFGRQAGLQVTVEAALTSGKTSGAVKGSLASGDALGRLLAGTGLTYRFVGSNGVQLERAPEMSSGTIHLGTVRVEGTTRPLPGGAGASRAAGWDGSAETIYATPGSVSVIGRDALEAYPAQSPADMLRGATGVISGEARTGGALDVNIRGLQGQGRVPVTVDGAINGTTVYRGYQGTSNRSYVDPDFISHVAIVKGPSNGNAIAGGIGGSVTMTTINVDDIIAEGDDMGIRVKASLSNNSVTPGSNMTRTLLEPQSYYGEPLAATRARDRAGFFSPTGGSASFVFARKSEIVDLLAGYSFRRTGNYFAGANGKRAPKATGTPSLFCTEGNRDAHMQQLCDRAVQFYDKYGATPFVGGEEVYNTSTNAESVLVKLAVRPADDHVLELGYGGYWTRFGENYPGAIGSATAVIYQNDLLSQTSLDRFTARYRWNPDNDLIDLKINGWLSKMRDSAPSLSNSDPARRFVNSRGSDLTNSSRLMTSFGLFSADYGASFLYEKAGPVGTWQSNGSTPPGREGSRREYSLFTEMALEPASWLRLAVGGRYQAYSLKDRQSGTVYHSELLKRSDDAFSYSLGATIMPAYGMQLFANYKQTSRLPSLMEATSGFFYVANPDLKKEEAHNWEVGANYTQTGLVTEDDALGLKLVWFDNDIEGYIARRYILQLGSMQMYNIDRARFRGVEGNVSYSTGGFSLDAGITYYDRIQFCRSGGDACIGSSLASDFATNYIPPRWSGNVSLNQKFLNERATMGARLTYMGKRAAGAEKPTSGYMPLISAIEWHPYVLLDLSGSYRLNEALLLNWSLDNLTDRYYNEPMSLGYLPAPGRTFRIGFTSTIGSKTGLWPGQWFSSNGNADPVDWTGPYAGMHIGYGLGKTNGGVTDSAGNPADLENGSHFSEKLRNMLGGFHAGFNYQLPGPVVVGIEGDISAGDLSNWSGVLLQKTGDDGYSVDSLRAKNQLESDTRYKWDRLITLRGRLGYSMGQTLIYGTAGIGWLRETQTRNQHRSGPTSNATQKGIGNTLEHYFTEKDRKIRTGAVLGGGVERSVGKRWSIRADYSYAHFGNKQFQFDKARAGASLDYGYYEIVGYKDMPGYTVTLPDGTSYEVPPYQMPIRERREVTGTSNIINGRKTSSEGGLHSIRVGVSYRF